MSTPLRSPDAMNRTMKPKLIFEQTAARISGGDRWPMEMRADTAAEYCDEPSPDAFKAKVKRGIYPEPIRGDGIHPKWHRTKLDEAIARRHGLRIDGAALIEDLAGLI